MRKIVGLFMISLFTTFTFSCGEKDKDEIYPEVVMQQGIAFPGACDTLYTGSTFVFRALMTDNRELGSYSIDVHQNFDHHTHAGEHTECPQDPGKTPVNPWVLIRNFSIPEGLVSYQTMDTIPIPSGVDPGDYHFIIRLTDKEGWQTIEEVDIKLVQTVQ